MKTIRAILLLLINTYSMCMEIPLEFYYTTDLIGYDFEQYDRERENKWWENLCYQATLKNMTPLSFACTVDLTPSTIGKILSKTDDINQQDPQTLNTALHSCVISSGHIEVIRLLLENSEININLKNAKGNTPLFIACARRASTYVNLLLATKKNDFSIKNNKNQGIVQFMGERYANSCRRVIYGIFFDACGNIIDSNPEHTRRVDEWTMHRIICATAKPIHCSLIMAVLSQEHIAKGLSEPLVKDILGKIAHLIYVLHNDLIVAKKYKGLNQGEYFFSSYGHRKQIKENIIQAPTAEDIRLLWEQ